MQWAEDELSTELMHKPSVGFIRDKLRIYPVRQATYMWISTSAVGTMAAVFASPAFNLGDVRVIGTLAAVRGAFAR
jgi:hypothetical protein